MHSDDLDVPIVSHLQTYMSSDDNNRDKQSTYVDEKRVVISEPYSDRRR